MSRLILHIDFDSFFATCEQHFQPHLRNRPIGVTATNGRSCIIASSVEAKRMGIKTAMNTREAKRLCPEIIFTPADFFKYWEISKQFVTIVKDYTPYVEVFSIDEVFMDVTCTVHLFGSVENIIQTIKNRIRNEIGEVITVSAGLSHNKLLAKLASGLNKPNGFVTIKESDIEKIYSHTDLIDICGIGYRIKFRLNTMGIFTLLQLKNTSLPSLVEEFGPVEGSFLKNVGLGIDTSPVIPYTEIEVAKSVGRQYCLPENEYNQRIILQNISELCEEIAIKLRRIERKAERVGLYLGGSTAAHGAVTLKRGVNSGKEIFNACRYLYDSWKWGQTYEAGMVRRISIWTGNLISDRSTQLELFENSYKKQIILKATDRINKKFGDHTIRNGYLLYADKLTTKPNGFIGDV